MGWGVDSVFNVLPMAIPFKTYADVRICTILGFDNIPHEKRAKNVYLSIGWARQRSFIRDFQFRSSFHSFATRLPTIPERVYLALACVRPKPETAQEKPLCTDHPPPLRFFLREGVSRHRLQRWGQHRRILLHVRKKRLEPGETCQKSRCWKTVPFRYKVETTGNHGVNGKLALLYFNVPQGSIRGPVHARMICKIAYKMAPLAFSTLTTQWYCITPLPKTSM